MAQVKNELHIVPCGYQSADKEDITAGPSKAKHVSRTQDMDEYLLKNDLEFTPDRQYVRWAKGNKKHPRNWSATRKVYDIGLIFLLDLFVTATSTAGASAASEAQNEYHIGNTLCTFCFVTLFLMGQVVGAIVFPPWSECFGRKKLYFISSTGSALCCLIIGVVHSLVAVVICRIVGGFLSAIPYTVGSGSNEDMFNSRSRIWTTFLWTIASNVGLLIGPIISILVVENLHWRWVFYIYTIILAVMSAFFLLIRESRPALLLAQEVSRIRHETGHDSLQPLNHDHSPDLRTFIKASLFRPLQLFFGELLIFTMAMMIAFSFALVYIFTEALQPIYESMNFTPSAAALPFLAVGVGVCFSTFTRILDFRIIDAKHAASQPVKPEDKLTGLAIGAPAFAIGLWWFAWTIPPKAEDIHWIVPTVSLVLIGYALNEFDTVLYGYLADSYLSYSASGTAAVQLVRAGMSGAFPLFTRQMFDGLGANVAASLLAALATVFCSVPLLFLLYGERIRAKSRFAKHSLEVQEQFVKQG
ncbi:MFS multidrug transporter [Aspergillus piperis CBS 112811]|uniref:MFS multidrug transporter n=1 Tax=Aspergillus piperis CBS 112811 TaxID=1448313 RepID=A0A8G1QUX6_9EURO|nr:MFS multidrug transporter [Aspergillus piperis CBS 112811]RAH54108.1 MFS multidrug transporter [Aspergillus piperis CBS 112811]